MRGEKNNCEEQEFISLTFIQHCLHKSNCVHRQSNAQNGGAVKREEKKTAT